MLMAINYDLAEAKCENSVCNGSIVHLEHGHLKWYSLYYMFRYSDTYQLIYCTCYIHLYILHDH